MTSRCRSYHSIVRRNPSGNGVVALALFKNSLLLASLVFTYLAVREIVDDERVALVAMFSMLLFPQITWESQRDLTHSVLATALAAATFFVALRDARRALRAPVGGDASGDDEVPVNDR